MYKKLLNNKTFEDITEIGVDSYFVSSFNDVFS